MKPSLPVICNYYGIRNPKIHLPPIKHAFAEQDDSVLLDQAIK